MTEKKMWRSMGQSLYWPSAESLLRGDPPSAEPPKEIADSAADCVITKVDVANKRITVTGGSK